MTHGETPPGAEFDMWGLPPTQSLALEVLAARLRLGEQSWSFAGRHRPALEQLFLLGLVTYERGFEPRTIRARLTEEGRKAATLGTYVSPVERLLSEALHICVNGEYAPGGRENWSDWAPRAETLLRSLLPEEEG